MSVYFGQPFIPIKIAAPHEKRLMLLIALSLNANVLVQHRHFGVLSWAQADL